MNNESFYTTLLSNSSMSVYPDNTTSSFTVHLPQKVTLHGKWFAAIAEIHYNYNFFNITRENSLIHVECMSLIQGEPEKMLIHKIDCITPGYYTQITDVISKINIELKKSLPVENDILSYNHNTRRIHINAEKVPKAVKKVHFPTRLSLQLGFKPNTNILVQKLSPFAANIHAGIPDQMFVYTDIIEPTYIGHEKAYVLKIINTQPHGIEFGGACYKEFEHLHYMPVERREFESISIDIRDNNGHFMPFLYGVLSVKLHFKKQDG